MSQANVLPGMWVQCVLKSLFIRKYVQRGTQRKANVDLGYLPMAFKIPEITLSSFETKIFFSDSSECHLTPLKMSAIKEKREKRRK